MSSHIKDEPLPLWSTEGRTSLQFTMTESPGCLNKAINILTSNQVNMTRIQSKPTKFFKSGWREIDFFIDVEGKHTDTNVKEAIGQLKLIANEVKEIGTVEVPWFPTRIEDFDFIGKKTLGEGDGIQEADHPSFRDPVYKKRRDYIASIAFDYRVSDAEIPRVQYNKEEIGVWKYCYPKLKSLLKTNACDETNQTIVDMEANVPGFSD